MVALDNDLLQIALVELRHELTEYDHFFLRRWRRTEQIEQQHEEQAHDQPKQQVFHTGTLDASHTLPSALSE